ncbi:unnamed protein product [Symbiodinium sp. CCMP2592]|nr:unnamed protein product [Symbiodinium sp. CCMP2592]
MCTMHKLGLQIWPSPDVMVLMSTKGTLYKVAMLSTALEDALAYCTVEEFMVGFKTVPGFPDVRHQAEQVLVKRGRLDHRAEPLPHIRRDGVAILSMCLRRTKAEHIRVLHGRGVCSWLQEEAGFAASRHQADQRLVRRGRLEYQTETWQPLQVLQRGVRHRRRVVRSDDPDSAFLQCSEYASDALSI